MFVDIDLDEGHLSKALNDFGGHYMRPDLVRLVVDGERKGNVSFAKGTERPEVVRTLERVGLNKPLRNDEETEKKPVKKQVQEAVNGEE